MGCMISNDFTEWFEFPDVPSTSRASLSINNVDYFNTQVYMDQYADTYINWRY